MKIIKKTFVKNKFENLNVLTDINIKHLSLEDIYNNEVITLKPLRITDNSSIYTFLFGELKGKKRSKMIGKLWGEIAGVERQLLIIEIMINNIKSESSSLSENESIKIKYDEENLEATLQITWVKEGDESLKSSVKNLSNSDLIIASGEVRTLDTTGAKFLIKGLQNRKNESAFNLRVKANERGELAVSDETDYSWHVTIPDNMNWNINYNPIVTDVNELKQSPEAVRDLINKTGQVKYKKFTSDDWTFNSMQDGLSVFEHGYAFIGKEHIQNNGVYTNGISISFPKNKEWIIKLSCESFWVQWAQKFTIGIFQSNSSGLVTVPNINILNKIDTAQTKFFRNNNPTNLYTTYRDSLKYSILIYHTNNRIYFIVQSERGDVLSFLESGYDKFGDYGLVFPF